MVISKNSIIDCHVSSNNSTKHDSEIGYISTVGVDSNTDTRCFGKSFQISSTKEQFCSITAFIDKLARTNKVSIITSATTMIDDYGEVFIALFGQGLNFTKKIYKGLINSNPFRFFFSVLNTLLILQGKL